MPEPLTPTPLSEAVARLTRSAEGATFGELYPEAHSITSATEAFARDIQRLLDAVAEGREKITEVLSMLERANSDLMFIESRHFDSVEDAVSEISDAASHVSDAVFTLKQAFPPPPAPTEPGADGGNDA